MLHLGVPLNVMTVLLSLVRQGIGEGKSAHWTHLLIEQNSSSAKLN